MLKKLFIFISLIVFAILIFVIYNSPIVQKRYYPLRYEDQIYKYSSEYNVDPYKVMAVIYVESRFNENAVSGSGAVGLMQIMPDTGEWISKKIKIKDYDNNKLIDPDTNIRIGCWYLNYLNSKFNGDFRLVLAAYNGGTGNVQKWLKDQNKTSNIDIPFKETKDYVNKVIKIYDKYKSLYKN